MTQEDAMNMTNKQAVQILKPLRDMMMDMHGCPISDAYFALDKAIKSLALEHYCRECKWSKCHINVDKYGNTETYWWCLNWDGGTDEEGYCHEWEGRSDI